MSDDPIADNIQRVAMNWRRTDHVLWEPLQPGQCCLCGRYAETSTPVRETVAPKRQRRTRTVARAVAQG